MSALQDRLDSIDVKLIVRYKRLENDGDWTCDIWRCKLTFQGRKIVKLFRMGLGHNGKEPTSADVVSCLLSDASCAYGSFEDFCSDLGYDTDSRKAYRTYKACVKTRGHLEFLFGETLMADLSSLDH